MVNDYEAVYGTWWLSASITLGLTARQRQRTCLDAWVDRWCKDRKENMFVEIDEDTQNHVTRIMRNHPRLVDTVKGRSGADPFVIALAATTNPSMVVVTEEFAGKTRIPDVCLAERIDCCRLPDLIEREDWKFGK
jgi:hypothetical protein